MESTEMSKLFASIVLYKHQYQDVKPTIDALLGCHSLQGLVLVDNGGCAWADQLEERRVHYIRSDRNGGYGHGHNQAIRAFAEQADYFLICNPDIQFHSADLDCYLAGLSGHAASLFMPRIVYPDGTQQELCKLLPSPANLFVRRFLPALAETLEQRYMLRHADFDKAFFAPSLSGCFMLFRAAALQQLNGFDDNFFMYMEDVDLSRRCAVQFGNLYLPGMTVTHHFAKASYTDRKLLKAHIRSAVQYFNKWGWLFDQTRRMLNKACLAQLPRKKA
ncbi:glycosyltransferase [Vogesella fluminis]|uniref:Glycosyl transferase n=1 Tax=Vogesella fluminis TaxID=1069161 RepID=A0ABQ3HCK7_9NEIS|nr:glycosyltransferase [Vogesella fluminis]GHD78398.1 glycosyl transferase [Vogesella fluminis]